MSKNNNNKSQLSPSVAVDALIFSIKNSTLQVLLIKISQGPYKNMWAIPGRTVKSNETLDEAAKQVLEEKGGIKGIYLEQLYSFGGIKRDLRKRVISVAYFALVDSDKFTPKTTEIYSDIQWKDVKKLPKMAFDHKEIIKLGLERLQSKIEYSNIAYALLPKEFTLTELQKIYEIILGKTLDKRNFRKRIKMLNVIESVDKTTSGEKSRPAELYRFKKRQLIFTK